MNDHVSVMILPVGPVSVATRVWRYRGQFHVTAVAKATFSLKNGEPMPTAAPLGLNAEEVSSKGAPGIVRAPYDLVPLLPRADVTFVGHAYAHGNGARTERVRLAISRPRDGA